MSVITKYAPTAARTRGMRTVIGLLVLVLAVPACGAEPSRSSARETAGSASGVGGSLAGVATVFPLAWIAEQVAPAADVAFLGARGQDPHDLELSPGDREAIETADVLVYMGELDFQPQVEQAVAGASGEVVSVADVAGAPRLLPFGEDDHAADDETDHADEHAAVDPHAWFDAGIMADVARQVGEAFAAADPDHTDEYAANAEAVAGELEALQAEVDELLDQCRFDTVIVSHDAYAYLLTPRGLRQEGISGAGGHGEASPHRLAELTERIREQGIPAIAAEPLEGRADAEVLAGESGAELVEIDPLEVADDEQLAAGYPEALREQAESFATALDCT